MKRAAELNLPADYVVLEENPDGTVLLGPDTSWSAIKHRLAAEEISQSEFDELAQQMLSPEGEG